MLRAHLSTSATSAMLAVVIAATGCGLAPDDQGLTGVAPAPRVGGLAQAVNGVGQDGLDNCAIGGTGLLARHDGPVMSGTVNVYYIWYGKWTNNTATTILVDLVKSLGGSPYFNINSTYSDSKGGHVANAVSFGGSATDSYSLGTSLNGTGDIASIITSAINAKKLPLDANGVYFVLTSSDVKQDKFCNPDCGWHTYTTISNTDIKYAWVGDPSTQCTACIPSENTTTSPNGNVGADSMANSIAHELDEAVTDPHLDAFVDYETCGGKSVNFENGDSCNYVFGDEYKVANGSKANVRLGGRDFLLQENRVNDGGGYCAIAYSSLFEGNTDRPGMDYSNFDLPSARPELCQQACIDDGNCQAFVYGRPGFVSPNAHCWLKNGVPGASANSNCISGVRAPLETDVNRAGLDYSNFTLSDARAELCEEECARDSTCKAFTYVPPNVSGPLAHCWLKSGVPVVNQTYPGLVSGVKGRREWSTDRPGMEYSGFFIGDAGPSVCESFCNQDAQCKTYTWVAPGIQGTASACWLKNGTPAANTNNVTVSDVRRGLEHATDRPGGDYRNFLPAGANPIFCQQACDADAQCRAFTYVYSSGARCYLKNVVPAGVKNSSAVSGLKNLAFF